MKLCDFFELGYLVNLNERKDRLEAMDAEFYKINYYPERFPAVKHQNGAVGCYLSHLEILKKARDANKNVVIFEDDCEFDLSCRPIIESALDEIYNMDWDFLYFGGNILRPFFQVTDHLARLTHCQSTHNYSISKKFVPIVVNFLENNSPEKTGLAIDQLYADWLVPNSKAFITIPMVSIQKSDFSTIEGKEMTYDLPIQRYNHFLVRK